MGNGKNSTSLGNRRSHNSISKTDIYVFNGIQEVVNKKIIIT